jgi:hypothetical protein
MLLKNSLQRKLHSKSPQNFKEEIISILQTLSGDREELLILRSQQDLDVKLIKQH